MDKDYIKDSKALEKRGIPRARSYGDWTDVNEFRMKAPSDMEVALGEMKRGETISWFEFKKEFKEWLD